jgi:hypothetical protein
MKYFTRMLAASLLFSTAALAQAFLPQQPEPPFKQPDAPQLPYHFSTQITGASGEQFGNVAAVAIRPNGNLLVFNRNPNIMMVEYDPTGTKQLRVFNPNIAMNPHALRVDPHGNIWVSDSFLNVIYKLNPNGDVIRAFGIRGENGPWDDTKWNGMFNQPLDIAWDKDDNFYVVQSHGGTSPPADCTFCATYDIPQVRNSHPKGVFVHPPAIPGSDPRVMKFDKDGKFLASASMAHADGKLPVIHSVAVAPNGEVWVTDRASTKIVVFDKDLKQRLREIQVGNLTCGLYVDATGQLWLSTGRHGMVLKMGWDGKIQGWFGKHGDVRDSHDVGEGHYMAVSKDQKFIFMADSVLAKVHRIEHN